MKKRFLSTLLALCMVLSLFSMPTTVYANGVDNSQDEEIMPLDDYLTYDYWKYSVDNGEVTIRGCVGSDLYKLDILSIPSKIEGMTVTRIGERAFYYTSWFRAKTVIIPSGVTSIGTNAFGGCYSLTSVSIPDSVINIECSAFSNCTSLTKINIPDGLNAIEDGVFGNCRSLSQISIPDSVARIGDGAFSSCPSLTQITIPDNVASIGNTAFSGSGLTSITIPASVETIGGQAFDCDNLSEITVNPMNSTYTSVHGMLIKKSNSTLVCFPPKKNTPYSIPSNITTIGECAFPYPTDITYIVIPSSITTIEEYGTDGLRKLTDVYYVGSEEDWGKIRIARYNDPLNNATIHYNSTGPDDPGDTGTQTADGVLRSGDGWKILWKCTWKDVNGTPTNGRVDITMEGSANRTDDLYIYNENSNQGFPWELAPYNIPKSAIKTLSISGDLVGKRLRIAANSFQGYSGLETVLLDDVTGIDTYAFEGCTALKSVGFISAAELTTIGKGAFKNCTSLTDMDMPGNLEHIGDEAFQNTALGTITLGRSVTEIGADAFAGCQNVKIRCYENSAAHRYAQNNQIPFELLNEQVTRPVVPFSIAGKTVDMEIAWNPSAMFSGNSSYYNQDLAIAGLVLSSAAEDGESVISNVMTTMGFSSTYQVHLGYRENNVSQPALSIAAQKAIINGQEKTLIALVVRGTDPNSGSDILTDVKSVFDGFDQAGRYAVNSLEGYIRQAFPNDDIVLFITGHSLGGATAGHAANSFSARLTSGNVFAYTYGCPRNQQASQLRLSNVHNIVNERDIVTFVPPNYWARIGVEHPHTTKNNSAFVNTYEEISGAEPVLKNPIDDHLSGTYMALLMSNQSISITKEFSHRLVRVLCPVDVEVYDKAGNLVGRVIDNTVDSSISDSDVYIMVIDDEKYIYLLEDNAYAFKLTGTDNGILEYSVCDFNTENELLEQKVFSNVELEPQKEMYSEVGEVETPEVKLYVVDSNGNPEKEVLPDGNGTEVPITTPTVTYTITLDGYQTMATNADGKLSSLPTPTRSGYTFVGWYMADGTRVTVNTVFRDNTTIYARWSENSKPSSSGSSSSGGSDSDYTPSYSISVPNRIAGGTIKVSPTSASENQRVTITVKPNAGYQLEKLIATDGKNNELTLTPKDENQYTFRMPKGKVSVNAVFRPIETPWSNPFQDVASSAWYYEAVRFVNENNIMSGYGDGTFAPDNNLSRAMLAQILYNNEGKPSVTGNSVFSDVLAGAWYANAVNWAAEHGIVTGYGNGAFGPDDNITREQLAVMLWRYAGGPVANEERLDFTDAEEVSNYALSALRWAVENKIINGKTDGTLDPKGLASRAQTAQMLKNFLDR